MADKGKPITPDSTKGRTPPPPPTKPKEADRDSFGRVPPPPPPTPKKP